jgi:hypothetical protein
MGVGMISEDRLREFIESDLEAVLSMCGETQAMARELLALRALEKAARERFAVWTRETYTELQSAFAAVDAARGEG